MQVVLIRPEAPANVGASARVIRNTGLSSLVLVSPGDWRQVECWRRAWGAQEILEQARVFSDLPSALADSSYVVALSGRRDKGAPALDVRDMAGEISRLGQRQVASLVYGPERAGLTRDELALCGRRAFIPSHPDQPSLNLSHAVMVAAYEVFRAGWLRAPAPRLASHEEKERMLALLRKGLRETGALPSVRTEGYFREWRDMLQRADLTPREVRLLEHMARKMAEPRWGRTEEGVWTEATAPDQGGDVPRRLGAPADRPRQHEASAEQQEGAARKPPSEEDGGQPFEDVRLSEGGFSIPQLKWRELLFVGALRPEEDLFVRDPTRPLPPFRVPGLFPPGSRFRARREGVRVRIERV